LGKHRLLCGDGRNANHVARLMTDTRAAMVFLERPRRRRAAE
jgi:hypothetical protein